MFVTNEVASQMEFCRSDPFNLNLCVVSNAVMMDWGSDLL
jgi:hypothetical protein